MQANGKADEAAKKAALAHDVPPQLLAFWRQHVEQAERAASTVAATRVSMIFISISFCAGSCASQAVYETLSRSFTSRT